MNEEQAKAAKSLQRVLNKCAKLGLTGGVFDGSFCVWPIIGECPHRVSESQANDFFGAVADECEGKQLVTNMELDGGAGN